jgi:homospermidine synthase
MNSKRHDGRLLMIGYGAVGRCTLPLLQRHVDMPREKITVMDFADLGGRAGSVVDSGSRFVRGKLERGSLGETLAKHVGPGDLLVDLGWNIGCTDILRWCHENDVRYVNTSVEVWDPYARTGDLRTQTLYARHMAIRRMTRDWEGDGGWKGGATAVLDHGANPGWVQHCTKQALDDIASRLLADGRASRRVERALERARTERAWGELARTLGVRTIHVSERDTQVTRRPKEPDEFVNTWSIEGFREEGTAPAEMGWGTHEKTLPRGALRHLHGPRNQVCLDRMGINTWVRSLVPKGESRPGKAEFEEIVGMVVRHGEAFSISEHLTVEDDAGRAAYRPTVHYAYVPCDGAWTSLHELRGRNYELQPRHRMLYGDIVAGRDIMGCLLMGHAYRSWWIGSLLDIEESRRLVPELEDVNATSLQVAASVVAALRWTIDHPREGVKLPDHLPHDVVLPEIREYLGPFLSEPADWSPLDRWSRRETGRPRPPRADAWQFSSFAARARL